jgi:hypothetical protein
LFWKTPVICYSRTKYSVPVGTPSEEIRGSVPRYMIGRIIIFWIRGRFGVFNSGVIQIKCSVSFVIFDGYIGIRALQQQ